MVASVQNPADLVNVALRRIGYQLRVADLFDGSEAANQALDIYGQTRDEMLRQKDWGFAERNTPLTVLKTAPSAYIPPTVWTADYPPLPWKYEYAYPDDCLKVRAIKVSPLFLFDPAPTPSLFRVANDSNTSSTQSQLATLALNSPGSGVYAPGDTINLSGGVQTLPAQIEVATTQAVSATIAAAGTGGTPGSATVTGTTGTGTPFQATVTISGGGAISSVDAIAVAGSYTVNPTDPANEPVTGGSLTGAQLNVSLGVATFTIFQAGVFTTESTTFTQASTSGSGTGATFQTATFTAISTTARTILSNVPDAICVYTGQITDPADWDADFTEAFAAALGRRLVPVLTNINAIKVAASDEASAMAVAEREQG